MDYGKERTFFESFIGKKAGSFVLLAQNGSARRNFLGTAKDSHYIVTSNCNVAENESFFYFSEVFSTLKLNTPQVYSVSEDRTMYVQEFLGRETLSEIIASEGLTIRTENLIKQSLKKLYALQISTLSAVDYSQTFEYARYDDLPITNDLFYFKNFIADVLEIPYHKTRLLQDFKKLTSQLQNLEPRGLMIRDFQARNIMVNDDDEVFFIDYQSAMNGPLMYDVVSFLYQAKADFPHDFKIEMLNYYFSFWDNAKVLKDLKISFQPLILIRYLQVLGAYGFRGLVQRKEHFLGSLSKGIKNLNHFAETSDMMQTLPELKKITMDLGTKSVQDKIEKMIQGK